MPFSLRLLVPREPDYSNKPPPHPANLWMKFLREASTREGGYSAAIGTQRSLPHWKELARQTDAQVLLIERDGELAEDFGADISGVAESGEGDRRVQKFMTA